MKKEKNTVRNDGMENEKGTNFKEEVPIGNVDYLYPSVNCPNSGNKLNNEIHASEDDDWAAFEEVNDPSSGRKMKDEVHAAIN